MSAKEISLLIENLLKQVNPSMCNKSDEILLNPYKEIIVAVEHRVSKKKLEKFQLYYQGISDKSLPELLEKEENFEMLLNAVRELIKQ